MVAKDTHEGCAYGQATRLAFAVSVSVLLALSLASTGMSAAAWRGAVAGRAESTKEGMEAATKAASKQVITDLSLTDLKQAIDDLGSKMDKDQVKVDACSVETAKSIRNLENSVLRIEVQLSSFSKEK